MPFPRPRLPHLRRASARQVVRRPAVIGAAALAVVLATATFLPDRTTPDEQARTAAGPGTQQASAVGRTEVTPRMRSEIESVVARGRTITQSRVAALGSTSAREALARDLTRCAWLGGQRYCLGVGFTTRTPAEVATSLARTQVLPGRETTGDLDPLAALVRTALLRPRAREAADRRELLRAAESVGKVWQLRQELEGVEVPVQFRTTQQAPTTTSARGARSADYPRRSRILRNAQTRSQNRTYWCGPATIQMIAWGASGTKVSQHTWARRLGTTTAGTAITDMVRIVNKHTDYDDEDHAGPYVALDISDYAFRQWYRLMMRHIHDYKAPVVLHPVLEKRYFPYLDDDASGHFQVGRGFDQNPDGRPLLGYYEPWDQSKFDPSEPFIPRVQWRRAYRSYRANQAHFQRNVGV